MEELNKTLREVQMQTQVQKYYDREQSPHAKDPAFFETRLPNEDKNYALSPAAKRAIQDGSLDPS